MKISIITVSYNSASTIEQTIRSVIEQSYSNIEYIIIDGGSTDGTVDIIRRYADKIAYWRSEDDDGIYDAMNKGIQVATGDYIQIIGSDDCLCSTSTIQQVVDSIDAGTDIFSAARYEVDEKRRIQILTTNETAKNVRPNTLPWMPHTGIFVKSSYMKTHLFDTSYKIGADYKFILSAYMDKNVVFQYVDFPVAYFSLAGVSNSISSELKEENNRLFTELRLKENFGVEDFSMNRNEIKIKIKLLLKKMNLLDFALCRFGKWEKHTCDYEFCRWCGRQ